MEKKIIPQCSYVRAPLHLVAYIPRIHYTLWYTRFKGSP